MRHAFKPRSYLVLASILTVTILFSGNAHSQTPEAAGKRPSSSSGTTSWGLQPATFPDWFAFETSATVNKWITQRDTKSMTLHSWRLWAAVTSPTKEKISAVPAHQFPSTWWPQKEGVFSAPPSSAAIQGAASNPAVHFKKQHVPTNRFTPGHRPPRWRTVAPAPLPGSQNPVSVVVQYDNDVYAHVQANQYYSTAVMNALNNSWGNTPLASQRIQNFPSTSVALKPTYQFASATQPTQLQYWTGPIDSTTPSTPQYGTWTNWVWIVPPGIDPATFKQQQNDGHEVVSVNDFYHFPLTAADFTSTNSPLIGASLFPNNPLSQSGFQPGDYAILVAMHVTTREAPEWTWQTFWWTPEESPVPASIQSKIKPPFNHFQTAVAYSYTQDGVNSPTSLPTLCYNPYLETNFDNSTFVYPNQIGTQSNCISCHRAAVWPTIPPASAGSGAIPNPSYVSFGVIDPGDPYLFGGQTKTDFLWGLQNNVFPPASP